MPTVGRGPADGLYLAIVRVGRPESPPAQLALPSDKPLACHHPHKIMIRVVAKAGVQVPGATYGAGARQQLQVLTGGDQGSGLQYGQQVVRE